MKRSALITEWGFSPTTVSAIIRATDIESLPATVRHFGEARGKECHTSPPWQDVQAHVLNGYLETFGVESLELIDRDGNPVRVEYLNTGDTYDMTLCRVGYPSARRPYEVCTFGNWHVSSWGNYAEKFEDAETY